MKNIEESYNTTIVLTPTLSLMTEYIEQLKKLNLSYFFMSMHQSIHNVEQQIEHVCEHQPRVIISTHEQVLKWGVEGFERINTMRKIGMFVFDEVHLDYMWGHSYRNTMIEAHKIWENFPTVTRVALTGTPFGGDISKVIEVAQLRTPFVSKLSLFRTNVYINVMKIHTEDMNHELVQHLTKEKAKTIIFTFFVSTAEKLFAMLEKEQTKAVYMYTGGGSSHRNKENAHTSFEASKEAIMVATSSLGEMSILQYICMYFRNYTIK